jgi:hypothetical protein
VNSQQGRRIEVVPSLVTFLVLAAEKAASGNEGPAKPALRHLQDDFWRPRFSKDELVLGFGEVAWRRSRRGVQIHGEVGIFVLRDCLEPVHYAPYLRGSSFNLLCCHSQVGWTTWPRRTAPSVHCWTPFPMTSGSRRRRACRWWLSLTTKR